MAPVFPALGCSVADELGAMVAQEETESAALADTARRIAAGVLSPTLVAASQAAIRAVAPDLHRGAIREAVADLRRLRTDPAVSQALANDTRIAQMQAALLIGDALWIGFQHGAQHRAEAWSTSKLTITAKPSPEDRAALVAYPIHGLTTAEHARGVALRLDEAVAQALAQPLTGSIDPAAIPAALAAVAQAHADRVSALVEEAFHVGVQAAVRAVGDAMIGAG